MTQQAKVLKQFSVRESSLGVRAGNRYGAWLVLGLPFKTGRTSKCDVVVQCDCGEVAVVQCGNLATGRSLRCNSCANQRRGSRTHGQSSQPLYKIWKGIRARCYNCNSPRYKHYGGRGIVMCEEWFGGYEAFMEWSMANGYGSELEIDRINVNGNYEPGNCRWVTSKVNCRNKRNNRLIIAFGETKCIADWADDVRCNVSYWVLKDRVRLGWEAERALTTPLNGKAVACDAA